MNFGAKVVQIERNAKQIAIYLRLIINFAARKPTKVRIADY